MEKILSIAAGFTTALIIAIVVQSKETASIIGAAGNAYVGSIKAIKG